MLWPPSPFWNADVMARAPAAVSGHDTLKLEVTQYDNIARKQEELGSLMSIVRALDCLPLASFIYLFFKRFYLFT